MKTCTKCSVEKPAEDFPKNSKRKDGLHSYCHECNRAVAKGWALANPERKKETDARRYPDKLAKAREKSREERRQKQMPVGVDPVSWENYVEHGTLRGISWKEDVTYASAHRRVWERFGKAAEYPCVHCGNPADAWSYSGACPNERFGPNPSGVMMYYSTNPEMYYPACNGCHRKYDNDFAHVRTAYEAVRRFIKSRLNA